MCVVPVHEMQEAEWPRVSDFERPPDRQHYQPPEPDIPPPPSVPEPAKPPEPAGPPPWKSNARSSARDLNESWQHSSPTLYQSWKLVWLSFLA